MAIYRFRIVLEDNEDISRDIEIKSNQTFFDFHDCIQDAVRFDKKHAASFFVSDDYWRKEQEITLLEEDLEADVKLMDKTKIAAHVEHPYQRFIYVFDKKVQWTFLIELIKIDTEKPKVNYPVCIKSVGASPKQYKQTIIENEARSLEPLLAAMRNGELADGVLDDDDEEELSNTAYKQVAAGEMGLNDGDLDFAQSEEGEEDETAEGEEDAEDSDEYEFGGDHDGDEHE